MYISNCKQYIFYDSFVLSFFYWLLTFAVHYIKSQVIKLFFDETVLIFDSHLFWAQMCFFHQIFRSISFSFKVTIEIRRFLSKMILNMSFHVQRQVITSGKGTFTQMTFEWFHASVLAVVTCELVWAGKPPGTSLPGTAVGLLTSVGPLVSLQMRTLCVNLK